jgi:predicted dehydrogenase
MMNVGIIGAGIQGKRRANALKQLKNDQLFMVADSDIHLAGIIADDMHCQATDNWEDVINSKEIDAVIVCTPTFLHLPMCIRAFKNNKHVLCEKPLGRNPDEARSIIECAGSSNRILGAGFNHRFHPAVYRAHEMVNQGFIGPVNFIRSRYGHTGREGYEKEWRGNPDMAGGGQLMDQGVHIIDLFRWFLGDFKEATGFIDTYHWDIKPLEDNAFALLRTSKGQIASLHVSWTQWKNLFSFEVFGQEGYLIAEGLGGSYGVEKLITGKRPLSNEPFKQEIIEFTSSDNSWNLEWQDFTGAIKDGRQPLANGNDGLQAIKIAYALYDSNISGKVVQL